MPTAPFRVLFVCEHNARQSQMAEGWLRHVGGDAFLARSAGVDPLHLDPLTTRVMQEVGVDVAQQRGKNVTAFTHERFDLVVTLCDAARDLCPDVPRAPRVHHAFEDPSWLEDFDGVRDLDEYRRVRDEIGAFVRHLVAERSA